VDRVVTDKESGGAVAEAHPSHLREFAAKLVNVVERYADRLGARSGGRVALAALAVSATQQKAIKPPSVAAKLPHPVYGLI